MKAKRKGQPAKNKYPVWILIGLVLVVAIAAVLLQTGKNNTPTTSLPQEVSVQQAKELQDSGAFLLDVREPSEWNEVHVPGATLIPLGELESRLNEVPKDKQVVVICRSGNRSQTGRDILLNAGLTNVTSVSGGMLEWQTNNFPTVSGP